MTALRQLIHSTSLTINRRLLHSFLSPLLISSSKRLQHMLSTMETAPEPVIVNQVEGQVQLRFTYTEPALNFERVFNMDRSAQEQVGVLTARITSNIEKFLTKKAAKVNKKRTSDGSAALDASITRPAVSLLLDDTPAAPEIPCVDVLVTHGSRASLHIGRLRYRLSVNPPAVLSLSLPTSLMAGFPVHPVWLQLAFADRAEMRWERQTSAAKEGVDSWETVGEGRSYTPTAKDVGRRLRVVCVPVEGERRGEAATAVSEPIQAGPGPCPFDERHAFTREFTGEDSYRVVSYNILADLYADSDFTRTVLHPYCPPYALHIDYRKQLIVKEVMGYNGDVVCLQEVDRKVYNGDLEPMLQTAGLEGVYTKKGGQVTEGLVCFYRTSKLKLLDTERVVLGEVFSEDPLYADIEAACSQNDKLRERLTKRTQTLQVNVFECAVRPGRPARRLVVANTHLYFHPDADHVRALQVGVCMRHLQRRIERLRTEDPTSEVSLLFCGDFNSCPEFSVLRLMTSGRLEEDLADFSSAPGEEVRGVSFHHQYRIASACGTPEYTNYVGKFVGCLDYIFYMTDHMKVAQVVPLPSHEDVTRHTALPSVVLPSDHLALVADLRWRETPPN